MKRSELTASARRALGRLVAGLYEGDLVQIEVEGQTRLLCFADRDEALPELPLCESIYGAMEPGVFVSQDLYTREELAARGHAGEREGRWMRIGPLDRTLEALEWAAPDRDIEALLESYAFQRSLCVATGTPGRPLEISVSALPSPARPYQSPRPRAA